MNLKRELSFTVFFTGAAVLALEILASRYMVPAFGTSLSIWGAILAVTLVCLAIGYSWGGKLADGIAKPHNRLVGHTIIAAGAIALLPLWGGLALRVGMAMGPSFGPIVVSLLLLSVPLVLLATMVPLAFGVLLRDSADTPASLVSDLFAVSTIGSVAGALATAYAGVPYLGVRRCFLVVVVLLVVAVLPRLVHGVAKRASAAVLVLILASQFIPATVRGAPHFADGVRLLHSEDTAYGRIVVVQDDRDDTRTLLLDGAPQAWAAAPDWLESRFPYPSATLRQAVRWRGSNGKRALVLGLGGATLVRMLARAGYDVDAVEIDPAVHRAATRYFGLKSTEARVHHGDARAFLTRAASHGRSERWDLIVFDATGGGSYPEHVYSLEACRLARALLSDGGVAMFVAVAFTQGSNTRVARHLAATVAAAFEHTEAIDLEPSGAENLSTLLIIGSDTASHAAFEPRGVQRSFEFDKSLRPFTDDWSPMSAWSSGATMRWHRNLRRWLGDAAAIPW